MCGDSERGWGGRGRVCTIEIDRDYATIIRCIFQGKTPQDVNFSACVFWMS